MSTILQGRPLITTKPFLRRAEHCIGNVRDAPASADSKVTSCCNERKASQQGAIQQHEQRAAMRNEPLRDATRRLQSPLVGWQRRAREGAPRRCNLCAGGGRRFVSWGTRHNAG